MNLPSALTKDIHLSKPLRLLILLIILFIGFFLGVEYQKKTDHTFRYPAGVELRPTLPPVNCDYYESDGREYLLHYKVKSGDTLLGIASNQLGSTSRVNEIIGLNKDRYPLSLEKPFLEQGWILYLPPSYVKSSSGNLMKLNGGITQMGTPVGKMALGGKGGNGFYHLITNKNTILEKNFKIGDCVGVIFDYDSGIVYKITSN